MICDPGSSSSSSGGGGGDGGGGGAMHVHQTAHHIANRSHTPTINAGTRRADTSAATAGLLPCKGLASGSISLRPPVNQPPKGGWPPTGPVPSKLLPPHSRRCADLTGATPVSPLDQVASVPEGMDRLVMFARQNRLKPTCNLAKLRRWGGFPIPPNYCKAGPGTYFGVTSNSAGGAVPFRILCLLSSAKSSTAPG